MKSLFSRTQFFALCVLLCASASAAFAQTNPPPAPPLVWKDFTSGDGTFKAKFPSPPKFREAPFKKGPVNFVRHVYEASVPGLYTFELDYMDMPAGYNDPDLSTEGGITGMTRSLVEKGGRVLTNTQVRQGTCDGREATVAIPNPSKGSDAFAHGRIFNSGQRYYFLVFVGEVNSETTRQVGQAFMDSFSIRDGCKAPVAPTVAPTVAPARSTVEGTRDAATGWRRIENVEQGFSLLMPGAAARVSTQAQVQPFELFHHEYLHETPDAVYSAEVIGEYPEGFYNTATSFENLLDSTLFAVKRNFEPLGFTYGAPRKLNVGRFPGREYDLDSTQTGPRGRIQIYATPKRSYVFIYINRIKKASDPDLERYFSSIRVSPK